MRRRRFSREFKVEAVKLVRNGAFWSPKEGRGLLREGSDMKFEAPEHLAGGMAVRCMGVSRSGFHAWLNRSPSARSRNDEAIGQRVKASFVASDRTYRARRVWRDLLAEGLDCSHRIERLSITLNWRRRSGGVSGAGAGGTTKPLLHAVATRGKPNHVLLLCVRVRLRRVFSRTRCPACNVARMVRGRCLGL
jgi:hypothetical protein